MTAPVVESTSTSTEASDTTTHTVDMPSGVTSGDLLIMIFVTDGISDALTGDWTDWTELDRTTESENAVTVASAYKISDGTEGSTESITSGNSQTSGHIVFRISGDDSSTNPPELGTVDTGKSDYPDSDGITPAGGSDDYLYISYAGMDSTSGGNFDSFPSNFTTNNLQAESTGSGACCAAACTLSSTASTSANPNDYNSAFEQWVSATIAVYPGGAAVVNTDILVPTGPLR